MTLGLCGSTAGAHIIFFRLVPILCGLAVAGCNTAGPQSSALLVENRSATVAFDSIDGAPRPVFDTLVRAMNAEAQERRLAVIARDAAPAYRVRGYLGASKSPRQSAVSWVWDVYDTQQQRVLRITGEEQIAGTHNDPWQAVDDAVVRRIAHKSVEQLASFLTSAEQRGTPANAYGGDATPEAAGIFRMPAAHAEPVRADGGSPSDTTSADQAANLAASKRQAASRVIEFSPETPQGTN